MCLQDTFQKGFLAGPSETEEAFHRRIRKTEEIVQNPKLLAGLPPGEFSLLSPSLLCLKGSKKLPFWYGAMTWICEVDETLIPILQLPKRKRLPWLNEEEIIKHEKVHALRAAFHEPKFEEILAFRTSSSCIRRYFGPLFQNGWESALFLVCAGVGVFTPLPLLLFSCLALARLVLRQKTFSKALKNLNKTFSDPGGVITCLTDREIILYAKNQESLIAKDNLRWQQIHEVFG